MNYKFARTNYKVYLPATINIIYNAHIIQVHIIIYYLEETYIQ